MGFHMCIWCHDWGKGSLVPEGKVNRYSISSSGDVTIKFENGHSYVMPDMILHYVADHGYQPPVQFMDDVMNGKFAGGNRAQTKDMPTMVGYLTEDFVPGNVPEGFVGKLEQLMKMADDSGNRRQTRGM